MGNLGEMLKAAREAKGISLTQAEEETKIRKRYLEALENEEFDVIPGLVYTKGFLRAYATYLGLNQDEVITEFRLLNIVDQSQPQRRTQVKYQAYSSSRRRKKLKWRPSFLTVFLALAAVLTLFLFNNVWNNDGDNAVKPPVNNNSPITGSKPGNGEQGRKPTGDNSGSPSAPGTVDRNSDGQTQTRPEIRNPQPGQQLNLVLTTKDQASWARIVVDGVQKYSGIMSPGQVTTYHANDKIYIKLGSAGAVEVTYNGQNLGFLGPLGTVEEREFSRSGVSDSVYSTP